MDIFGNFDDSVFCETKHKLSVNLLPYKAKFCVSQWFCESSALDTEDSLEKQKVFKFRGDLAFRQRNYKEALEAYKSCLEWVPDSNLTIRRDVWEGIARCYSNLGQGERALEVAELLSTEVSNTCHLTSLLLLKVSIHQHSGAIGAKIVSLEKLCTLLPFNPWHWFNLGQTCLHQLEANTSLGADGSRKEEGQGENRRDEEGEDRSWLEACMSFIRTRLLLRLLRQQQTSFALQRSESALCSSDEALLRLNPAQERLQALTAVMSEDLVPEKMREDSQDGEGLASYRLQSFDEFWLSKVLGSQCRRQYQYSSAINGCQATTDIKMLTNIGKENHIAEEL